MLAEARLARLLLGVARLVLGGARSVVIAAAAAACAVVLAALGGDLLVAPRLWRCSSSNFPRHS